MNNLHEIFKKQIESVKSETEYKLFYLLADEDDDENYPFSLVIRVNTTPYDPVTNLFLKPEEFDHLEFEELCTNTLHGNIPRFRRVN